MGGCDDALLALASALVRVLREWSLPRRLFFLLNHPSPANDPSILDTPLFPRHHASEVMALVLALGIPAQYPQLLAISLPMNVWVRSCFFSVSLRTGSVRLLISDVYVHTLAGAS